MIIKSKEELRFCLMADHMMNRGSFRRTFTQRLIELIRPDLTMRFLRCMRKLSYYKYKRNPLWMIYHVKYQRLGIKLGYTIGPDVFGHGLVLPHYGTIVVGPKNTIGNYAVMHVCTLITSTGKQIGDNLFASTGVKISSGMELGNNVTIAANSVITKSFSNDNVLLVGMPATIKSKRGPWYEDNEPFTSRQQSCEELRIKMFSDQQKN